MPPGITALAPPAMGDTERFGIRSREVGKPFIVDVARLTLPGGAPPSGNLPVVFVTDGGQFFPVVSAIVRSAPGVFPPLIVVGIDYDTAGATPAGIGALIEAGVRRAEDFTPSADKTYSAFTPLALQTFERMGLTAPQPRLGRANAFLAFIDRELKPFLAARYSANVADSTLIGHSMGGLFALHVLFTSPQSFKRYVVLSPAVSYDEGLLFREEQAVGDIDARVFMGVGGADVPEILEGTPRLDGAIRARQRPSLRYTYRLFAGENHLSVYPGSVTAGLRAVLDPPALAAPAPARSESAR
ncbi:MAG TPA: alpha/beta hydrolase-fold protein [Gammaproteobacteria bacterium]|nr:alpha/beta hydrolase-fold protein [Gammaproteobacteria bacterium]